MGSTSSSSASRTPPAWPTAPQLVDHVGCIVDLSAAFRLKDAAAYPQWYGFTHDQPELLAEAVYGLPERHRDELKGARLIATPGCYVTAATLALAPLIDAGLLDREGIIVDAASGVSGAGRTPTPTTAFCTVDEDFVAYGLLDHRHTPEIEQNLGAEVLFTPHLAPMSRGILATCYARPATGETPTTTSLLDSLREAYAGEPFVVVTEGSPSTKATLGSNCAHVTVRYDSRTGYVVALCALDDLTKGASGGALQSANVALGLDETAGLPTVGLAPSRRIRVFSHPSVEPGDAPAETLGWTRRRSPTCSSRRCRTSGASPAARSWSKYGERARRHVGPRRADPLRRGHRADAPRRHPAGRRPRRRAADQRADDAGSARPPSSAVACGSPTPRPSTSPAWS